MLDIRKVFWFCLNSGLSTLVQKNVVELGFPSLAWQMTDNSLPSIISCWDRVFTAGGSEREHLLKIILLRTCYVVHHFIIFLRLIWEKLSLKNLHWWIIAPLNHFRDKGKPMFNILKVMQSSWFDLNFAKHNAIVLKCSCS